MRRFQISPRVEYFSLEFKFIIIFDVCFDARNDLIVRAIARKRNGDDDGLPRFGREENGLPSSNHPRRDLYLRAVERERTERVARARGNLRDRK